MGCMLINHNNGTGTRTLDLTMGPAHPREPDVEDFLSICLDSYFASVVTQCPFVVVDDGSTDDSVEIIARYSGKITKFISKKKNEGLTIGMNEAARILIDEHGCDIICRFDADIEFLTKGWDLRFIRYFETHADVGAVGACQLVPFGAIWALGDMVIHPQGYTHIFGFTGYPHGYKQFKPVLVAGDMVLGDVDCDSVMGCLAAFRSDVFDKAGGLRKEFYELRGETEDLNLRILLEGYRCVALGGVQFIHRHLEHGKKGTATYDTQMKIKEGFDIWPKLWGWDKLRPDLKAIYERWDGTPLVRNLCKLADGSVEYIGP